MQHILVIANGEPPSKNLFLTLLNTHSSLIAVDGGLLTCLKYGVKPAKIIGDFDSVAQDLLQQHSGIPQIHTPSQNKSDLEKTIDHLLLNHPDTITVCGALGRRNDHTLTNICLLSRYPGKVKFESNHETCFALPKTIELKCRIGQTVSLIPFTSQVTGVSTRGLKWELNQHQLNKEMIGISNQCMQESISISFTSGDLILCLVRD